MRVKERAELCVCDCQWLVLDNVFGYLRERQGHRREYHDAGDKVQTEEALCGKLFLHEWCRTDILVCPSKPFSVAGLKDRFSMPKQVSTTSR